MDQFALLDCTLRDGGYITDWAFGDDVIQDIIHGLARANLDFIECGYLSRTEYIPGRAVFRTIEQIGKFLPSPRGNAQFLAMADAAQFLPGDITPHTGHSIDGIRVVFYKHQVEQALRLCSAVKENGYKLFVQPMVTVEYTAAEYAALIEKILGLEPYGMAVVDTFGYMDRSDFREYFKVLDAALRPEAAIGFHSHNNMQLSFAVAQDVLSYDTKRRLIIDASLSGMGRGAGNLPTELVAAHYNKAFFDKYGLGQIIGLIGRHIAPIASRKTWGYSAYFYLTALYRSHPNFATYLLEKHAVSIEDFQEYLTHIPDALRTKCTRELVERIYRQLCDENRIWPKVSVVTVCYNAASSIEKTMRSVLEQTHKNIEYIIIDGLSEDSTNEIIRQVMSDYPIRDARHISERDGGIYDAMNKGIRLASGDFVLFMNAGDAFHRRDTVEKVLERQEVPDADLVYGDTLVVGKDFAVEVEAKEAEHILRDLRMPFCHQSVFIRGSLLKEYPYDARYRQAGDHDLFLRLFLAGKKFVHIPLVIADYQLGGISEKNNLLQLKEKIRIRERNGVVKYSRIGRYAMMASNRAKWLVKKILPSTRNFNLRGSKVSKSGAL